MPAWGPWALLIFLVVSTIGAYLYYRTGPTPPPPTATAEPRNTQAPVAPPQQQQSPPTSLPQTSSSTPSPPRPLIPAAPPAKELPKVPEFDQDMSQRLVSALQRGEGAAVLNSLLDRHANPHDGLFHAIESCNQDAARLLLTRGADPNWVNPTWKTSALAAAIPRQPSDTCQQREELLDLLFRHGARPNPPGQTGDSALVKAAALGPAGFPLAKKLLALNAPPHGALLAASRAYYPTERDCDPTLVEALLARGAKPANEADSYGRTPLMEAAANKCAGITRLFLQSGAPVNQTDNKGQTALHSVLQDPNVLGTRPREPIVQLLLQAGADPNLASKREAGADTPTLRACKFAVPMLDLLLQAGGDPNRADNSGRTCLHIAISHGARARSLVAHLLAKRVNVNPRNENGRTPLGEARALGMKDSDPLVKMLLDAKAIE